MHVTSAARDLAHQRGEARLNEARERCGFRARQHAGEDAGRWTMKRRHDTGHGNQIAPAARDSSPGPAATQIWCVVPQTSRDLAVKASRRLGASKNPERVSDRPPFAMIGRDNLRWLGET